jgi:CheY-like chemotaxis protein
LPRILLANDDPDLLASCQDALQQAGHTVKGVAGGRQALAIARRWRPDAAIFDHLMPDMNGTEAVRALRGDPTTSSIPVLMISATAIEHEAREAGVADFLAKPFEPDQLVERLDRLLNDRRS